MKTINGLGLLAAGLMCASIFVPNTLESSLKLEEIRQQLKPPISRCIWKQPREYRTENYKLMGYTLAGGLSTGIAITGGYSLYKNYRNRNKP